MIEGTHGRGRPWRPWCNDMKEWTNLSTKELLQSRKDWATWSAMPPMFAPVNREPTTTLGTE